MTHPAPEADLVDLSYWTTWPSREALSRSHRSATHGAARLAIRLVLLFGLLGGALAQHDRSGPRPWLVILSGLAAALVVVAYTRFSLEHRLLPSMATLALLIAGAFANGAAGMNYWATVLWCGSAVLAIQRMPLIAAVPLTGFALTTYAVLGTNDNWITTTLTTVGLGLAGYVMRLEAESRGNTQRMLAQERAARAAEAESAALRERGRIAREIHDVLAHSLSAQTVHLEAARLLIERGADRAEILDRVVAARAMARQGLAETRQALSALRGEMSVAEEFLRELVDSEGGRLQVDGLTRRLPAEAGLAVRRVAQEAFTNARKHAPGARVAVRLEYLPGEVELEVRDFGASPVDNQDGEPVDNGLRTSGAGYGLLGMRERAELLGGTLVAGPLEEGFVVRLRVPA